MLVAKLRGARERKRKTGVKVEGRKSVAEMRPATVALARQLARKRPKGGKRSLAQIAGRACRRRPPYARRDRLCAHGGAPDAACVIVTGLRSTNRLRLRHPSAGNGCSSPTETPGTASPPTCPMGGIPTRDSRPGCLGAAPACQRLRDTGAETLRLFGPHVAEFDPPVP
jgi:hypothetical protein